MKKTILVSAITLISTALFSQKKQKPICAGLYIDVPMEVSSKYGYGFNGISFGVGAWFGEQTPFTSIGMFLGLTSYQSFGNPTKAIIQGATLTVIADIKTKTRLLIAPTFSMGIDNYFDIGFKLGYAIDKQKTMYLTTFVSEKTRSGLGITIKLK